ncbi:hypothetical protein AB0N06_32545 [Streptomyces sp. NPDC051020]|uniref:hypothetical protein n=1 Tax=Streptomyces sp. NPDC051020 TaxID=3155409 RepID=UPI0034254AF6
MPEQRLGLATAVASYTAGPAHANGTEDAGTLRPSHLADPVVLGRDTFTARSRRSTQPEFCGPAWGERSCTPPPGRRTLGARLHPWIRQRARRHRARRGHRLPPYPKAIARPPDSSDSSQRTLT